MLQAIIDLYGASGIIPHMILTLDAKRRLTLPASLVQVQPGDHFQAEFDPEEDIVVFRRISRDADWLGVLRNCPVKMGDLPPRRRELPKRLKF
jgi:hypothetical protein